MSNEVLEMSIKTNCMRILEILDLNNLEELRTKRTSEWSFNRIPDCTELKHRMAQLRKDTLKAEKILYDDRGTY